MQSGLLNPTGLNRRESLRSVASASFLASSFPKADSDSIGPQSTPSQAVRSWRVLHACEPTKALQPLISGELMIGMRPVLVTRDGPIKQDALLVYRQEPATISLLTAWNDVRRWRKVLMESDPEGESDVVHAHSFTSGMAGVRNFPAVVFDIDRWIEDHAGDFNDSEHSWLARSFRVAEQFVLTRAAAVVTRCKSMGEAAVRRGTSPENLFVIPQACEERELAHRDQQWLRSLGISHGASILLYAPDDRIEFGSDGRLKGSAERLIAAFAIIASEVDNCYLLVDVAEEAMQALNEAAEAYELGTTIKRIIREDRDRAFASCDIVIAGRSAQSGTSTEANPNAVEAFASRRALLAADLMCNRDLSGNGRGCLWYNETDARDLAHRACFLARNPDFRRALADAGHGFYLETRSAVAVAQQYDIVYRHAFARRKSGGLQTPATRLLPIRAAL